MSGWTLEQAASAMGGELVGPDVAYRGVSTDTRSLSPGSLFVALEGPRFDGHAFVASAHEQGAVGAVVARSLAVPLPQILVTDTRRALGRLGAAWRRRYGIAVIGVTGANGKTTVKEMLRAILVRLGPVHATEKNHNNEIGVPLTLLGIEPWHRSAVIELGGDRPGEVGHLADLAAPTVAVLTNSAPAHLEGYGSIEAAAAAEGEIFGALAPDAVAVVNADDAFAPAWLELCAGRRVLRFALAGGAEFTAREIRARVNGAGAELAFTLVSPEGEEAVRLPMAGRHNVANALAAAAAATAAGATLADVAAGLADCRNVTGRLTVHALGNDVVVYDDSYNANPASMQAAIDFLAELPRRRWLVVGDMLELGPEAERFHAEVGRRAREAGIERLVCVGELARHAAAAYGANAACHADADAAARALATELEPGLRVLVKGSHSMHLERVVRRLLERRAGGEV